MSEGHTPGLLSATGFKQTVVNDESGNTLALHPSSDGTTENATANALRIAATWNACAGIPTSALESGVIAEMREALKSLLYAMDAVWGHDDDVFGIAHNDAVDADENARAILAKLTPQ